MPHRIRNHAQYGIMSKRNSSMTYAAVEKMLLGWPGVELSRSYGRPSLKVKGKFFTWVKEDGDSIVIGGIGFDERDMLMETARVPQKGVPVLRSEYAQVII
jgi:hypothetical protein